MNAKQDAADKYRIEKKYRTALQLYLELIREGPANGLAYQGAAQCYWELKNHDAAVSACGKAIELNQNLAIPHIILAKNHARHRDFDKALAEALKAYEKSPELEEVVNLYGVLLLNNGNVDKSIWVLRQASGLHPESASLHQNLAVAYRQKRDFKNSVEEMRLKLKYHPSPSSVYWLLVAYQQQYFFWITLLVMLSLASALLFKSRVFLVIPAIMAIQGLFWDLEFVRDGRWRKKSNLKTLAISFLTDCALAIAVYAIYVTVSPG